MNQLISLLAAKSPDSNQSVKCDETSDQHLINLAKVESNLKSGQVERLDYTHGHPLLIRALVSSVWTLLCSFTCFFNAHFKFALVSKPSVECTSYSRLKPYLVDAYFIFSFTCSFQSEQEVRQYPYISYKSFHMQ